MKRKERRHLKENELAHSIAAAREYLEPRSKQLRAAVIAVVALIAIALVVLLVRQRSTAKSEQLLAEPEERQMVAERAGPGDDDVRHQAAFRPWPAGAPAPRGPDPRCG